MQSRQEQRSPASSGGSHVLTRIDTVTDGTSIGVVLTAFDTAAAVRLADARAASNILLPASNAAWLKVKVPVQVIVAATARVPLGLQTMLLVRAAVVAAVGAMSYKMTFPSFTCTQAIHTSVLECTIRQHYLLGGKIKFFIALLAGKYQALTGEHTATRAFFETSTVHT